MADQQQNPRLTINSMARIMENVDLPSHARLRQLSVEFAVKMEDVTKGLQAINSNMLISEQTSRNVQAATRA